MKIVVMPICKLIVLLFLIVYISFLLLREVSIEDYEESFYYVDSIEGNDNNDGLSEDTAWKTIEKVNAEYTNPNCNIYFKSNGIYRGNLITKSYTKYTSYGDGNKPVLLGSVSKSDIDDWEFIGDDLWKSVESFDIEVGNIILNDSDCAYKKYYLDDILNQNDFWYDDVDNFVYYYSNTNPASLYDSVEIAFDQIIVTIPKGKMNIEISNLFISNGAGHGFGAVNCNNVVIKNCDFNFIGGGTLNEKRSEPVRYGNAIEFYGTAKNIVIENNVINNVYDSGITHQNWDSSSLNCVMENITISGNIINNCGLASYEFNNYGKLISKMEDILFENNICLNAGYGFGGIQRPDKIGSNVLAFPTYCKAKNIVIENNVFYNAYYVELTFVLPRKNVDEYIFNSNKYYISSMDEYSSLGNLYIDDSNIYTYYDLNEWKTDSGFDLDSVIINDLEYIDQIISDYNLD